MRRHIALRSSANGDNEKAINIVLLTEHTLKETEARRKNSASFGDSAASIRLSEHHSDSTNAMRSFRCAAVKELKLFLAVVACPACS